MAVNSIWKFVLGIREVQDVSMPSGAKVIHVAEQQGELWIWAVVDPLADPEPRRFAIVGTGHPCPDDASEHVGTALMHGGSLVWHVFERKAA